MDWCAGMIGRSRVASTAALVVLLALAVGLLDAPRARALVVHLPNGRMVGIAPRAGVPRSSIQGVRAAVQRQLDNGSVDYQGGPVVHSSAPYLIFWDPSSTIPSSTKTLLTRYLTDVAHDSGLASNVYGVLRQYSDLTGIAGYEQTFSSSQVIVDTTPYPALDGATCTRVDATNFPICLTDAQVQSEITHLISVNQLPTDGTAGASDLGANAPIYLIVTPANVNICTSGPVGSLPAQCADNVFCAYHSRYTDGANNVLYSPIPLLVAENPAFNPKVCQSDNNPAVQQPNGDGGDVAIKYLSHEVSETITDPLLNAWYDTTSLNEIGDNCNAYDPSHPPVTPPAGNDPGAFKPTLGGSGTAGTLYDQLINGDPYYTQSEWSNGNLACRMQPSASTVSASFTAPSGTPSIESPVTFDPSASSSTGGYSSIAWSFGDGATSFTSTATTASPVPVTISHTYTMPGNYTITLTLVDAHGNFSTTSHPLTIVGPTASFSFSPTVPLIGQSVAFDGTGSSETKSGATISSWDWSFGDGAVSSGSSPTPAHTYASPGIYTVHLTVTDSDHLTSMITQQIQVLGPPTAAFTVSPSLPLAHEAVAFNGTTSSDPNPGGSLTSYSWSFGDGATASGAAPSHGYASPGIYTVALTVANSFGLLSATVTKQLRVAVLPNASFIIAPTTAVARHAVTFTASGSDPNIGGSISSFSWSFGDGAGAAGATASHAFVTPGTYTPRLTVADDFGLSTSVSHSVVVIAPGKPAASGGSLSGVGKRRPKLSIAVAAGANAPGLTKIVIGLPGGLSFTRKGLAKGVSVKGRGGQHVAFTARLSGGKLTITLKTASGAVKMRIGGRALTASRTLAHRVKRGKVHRLRLSLTAIDSAGTRTPLTITLGV